MLLTQMAVSADAQHCKPLQQPVTLTIEAKEGAQLVLCYDIYGREPFCIDTKLKVDQLAVVEMCHARPGDFVPRKQTLR